MIDAALQTHLLGLEQEMHLLQTRQNRERMGELLHEEFREYGRSGHDYTRAEILAELEGESFFPEIGMTDVAFNLISEGVVLLTYTSFHRNTGGGSELHSRYTLRASLWVKQEDNWRLRFHQGTAKAESPQD